MSELGEITAITARSAPSSAPGRFLNISSMRSVTNQPPTTFALASTIATKPITLQEGVVGLAEHDDRADDDDAVDEVRPRHQRRVQHRRHLRDHLDPEEDREHEDGQLDHEARGSR